MQPDSGDISFRYKWCGFHESWSSQHCSIALIQKQWVDVSNDGHFMGSLMGNLLIGFSKPFDCLQIVLDRTLLALNTITSPLKKRVKVNSDH